MMIFTLEMKIMKYLLGEIMMLFTLEMKIMKNIQLE
jgi:hypothetical protein